MNYIIMNKSIYIIIPCDKTGFATIAIE